MVASITDMAKAKKPKGGGESHPRGGLMTIGQDERARLKKRREELGLKQDELADRIGVTAATISNVETARHPQVRKKVYADLVRVLFRKPGNGTISDETYAKIVNAVVAMDAGDATIIDDLIESLKRKRSGST